MPALKRWEYLWVWNKKRQEVSFCFLTHFNLFGFQRCSFFKLLELGVNIDWSSTANHPFLPPPMCWFRHYITVIISYHTPVIVWMANGSRTRWPCDQSYSLMTKSYIYVEIKNLVFVRVWLFIRLLFFLPTLRKGQMSGTQPLSMLGVVVF